MQRSEFSYPGLKDIVSISDFKKQDLEWFLEKAEKIDKIPKKEKLNMLEGFTVALLFFEPSTRTKLSFETAAKNLGASTIGFDSAIGTSMQKGESLHDTIKTVERYADIIVMRNKLEGSARFAAEISKRPIINAGDGANQHPTQTLLDLYTIKKAFGKIDKLKIALMGDLRYGRTVHSLSLALRFFNVEQYYISPKTLEMPSYIKELVSEKNKVVELNSLEDVIDELDLIYCTRIQKERFADPMEYEKVKKSYTLTAELLTKGKESLKVMHPLPRVNELDYNIDRTKYALYFEQLQNGVPVRQAILLWASNVKKV